MLAEKSLGKADPAAAARFVVRPGADSKSVRRKFLRDND
jgi:hypothetical protein